MANLAPSFAFKRARTVIRSSTCPRNATVLSRWTTCSPILNSNPVSLSYRPVTILAPGPDSKDGSSIVVQTGNKTSGDGFTIEAAPTQGQGSGNGNANANANASANGSSQHPYASVGPFPPPNQSQLGTSASPYPNLNPSGNVIGLGAGQPTIGSNIPSSSSSEDFSTNSGPNPYPNSDSDSDAHDHSSSHITAPSTSLSSSPNRHPTTPSRPQPLHPFDTHAFVTAVERSGFEPETARSLMEVTKDLISTRSKRARDEVLHKEDQENVSFGCVFFRFFFSFFLLFPGCTFFRVDSR